MKNIYNQKFLTCVLILHMFLLNLMYNVAKMKITQ